MAAGTNGWTEWSKHVLKELERLNEKLEGASEQFHDLENELTKIAGVKHVIAEIKTWKDDFSENMSKSDALEIKKDIKSLREFKTKIITAITIITFLLSAAIALLKVYG